jgi:spermidine synthase
VWASAGAALGVAMLAFCIQNFGFGMARARGDAASEARLLDLMAWIGRDSSEQRLRLGRQFARAGDREAALRQFERAGEIAPGREPHLARGWLFARAGEHGSAAQEFERSLAFVPDDPRVALSAARAQLLSGNAARAREIADRVAAAATLESPGLQHGLATLRLDLGDPEAAVRHYREALALQPGRVETLNDLAWLLATGDPRVRDAEESVRIAQQLIQATPEPDPNALDTLAAAYAAAGRFPEAIEVAARARQLAQERGEARVLESIEQRLALYRRGRAFVEASEGG